MELYRQQESQKTNTDYNGPMEVTENSFHSISLLLGKNDSSDKETTITSELFHYNNTVNPKYNEIAKMEYDELECPGGFKVYK